MIQSRKNIIFCYKHLINIDVKSAWEKHVFEETYNEFIIQSAIFQIEKEPKESFSELIQINKNTQQINHLLAIRIAPSIKILNQKIYNIIDILEETYLEFNNFKIELIQSHINNKSKHQFYIHFISKEYVLHDFINNHYLVSNNEDILKNDVFLKTFMYKFQSNLAISYIKNE